MKTTKELKTQAEELFQGVRKIDRYKSMMVAMDNSIYELSCSYDAIDSSHPKADSMKKTIECLINMNEILLEGFDKHVDVLGEMADKLSQDLLN